MQTTTYRAIAALVVLVLFALSRVTIAIYDRSDSAVIYIPEGLSYSPDGQPFRGRAVRGRPGRVRGPVTGAPTPAAPAPPAVAPAGGHRGRRTAPGRVTAQPAAASMTRRPVWTSISKLTPRSNPARCSHQPERRTSGTLP